MALKEASPHHSVPQPSPNLAPRGNRNTTRAANVSHVGGLKFFGVYIFKKQNETELNLNNVLYLT